MNGDDWFWLLVLTQSAMLFACSYQLIKNARMIERLSRALGEATVMINELRFTIGKLLAERDAWRSLHNNDNVDALEHMPADARAALRGALQGLLDELRRKEH